MMHSLGTRFRIKICGITRQEDARCAVMAGVDALGFIFYIKSPRAIQPEQAQVIIAQLPPLVAAVGVFVDADLETAAHLIRTCGLSHAQLHGNETPEYCRQLAIQLPGCRIFKAVRVGLETAPSAVQPYLGHVQGFVLDTLDKNSTLAGGTGNVFDWGLIQRLGLRDSPFLLAGGLGPDNVGEALRQVRPYGVDANSVLEDAPGQKNHHLIRRFVAAVRAEECFSEKY